MGCSLRSAGRLLVLLAGFPAALPALTITEIHYAPPAGEFAPGVVYLERCSGAPVVPIAVWKNGRGWRRRYVIEMGAPVHVPESLDLEAGAEWLRRHTLALYERAKRRGEST